MKREKCLYEKPNCLAPAGFYERQGGKHDTMDESHKTIIHRHNNVANNNNFLCYLSPPTRERTVAQRIDAPHSGDSELPYRVGLLFSNMHMIIIGFAVAKRTSTFRRIDNNHMIIVYTEYVLSLIYCVHVLIMPIMLPHGRNSCACVPNLCSSNCSSNNHNFRNVGSY